MGGLVVLKQSAIAVGLLFAAVGHVRADCADLSLVLAIDASGSIDSGEFALQQEGYVGAFRSPRVQASLAAAGVVDIAVILWGDAEFAPQILPWRRLQSASDAERLAGLIDGRPRVVAGNTGIGRGVTTAIDMLQEPDRCGWRKLVNVSGDSIETLPPRPRPRLYVPLHTARERAVTAGISINALATETDDPNLSDWYRNHLIKGPGAFVMVIGGFEDFGGAILEKPAREIAPPVLAAIKPAIWPDSARN